jgi:hypothetical protein
MINFFTGLKKEVDEKLQEVEFCESNVLKKTLVAMEILTEAMEKLKAFIKSYQFKSEDEEIRFFKELKPKIFCRLIYYQKIYNLEMNCPTSSMDAKRGYYQHELDILDDFSRKRIDFVRYYRSGSSHLDRSMFLRYQNYAHLYLDSFHFERDDSFSTVADYRIAKLMANDLIQVYINHELQSIKDYGMKIDNSFPRVKLSWTGKKTGLIELLYALDAVGCFNMGEVSLNQLAAYFENVFNTDLSNFSRDFYEMRIRNEQTPFMDKLKECLKKRMDDPKKPYKKDDSQKDK